MKMLKNIGKLFNQENIRLLHKNNNKNTIRIKKGSSEFLKK